MTRTRRTTLALLTGAGLGAAFALGGIALPAQAATPVTTAAQLVTAFQSATAAGSEVTLGADLIVTQTLTLAVGAKLTIDFAGHDLSLTGDAPASDDPGGIGLVNHGSLELDGGSATIRGHDGLSPALSDGTAGGDGVLNAGTLTMTDMMFSFDGGAGGTGAAGGDGGDGGIGLDNSATVHVTGGTGTSTLHGGSGGPGGDAATPDDAGLGGNGGAGIQNDGLITFANHETGITGGKGGAGGDSSDVNLLGGNGGTGGDAVTNNADLLFVGGSIYVTFPGFGGAGGSAETAANPGDGGAAIGGSDNARLILDANDGTVSDRTSAYTDRVGDAISALGTLPVPWPVYAGHTLTGWYDAAAGGAVADPTEFVEAQHIYAQWALAATTSPGPTATGPTLAATGLDLGPWPLGGAVLLALGGVLVVAARRRPQS